MTFVLQTTLWMGSTPDPYAKQFFSQSEFWLSLCRVKLFLLFCVHLQVAVLLHVGGSGEHLYLLCHLLCCPAGVGKWAAHFLQVCLRHRFSFVIVMVVVNTHRNWFFSQSLPQIRIWGSNCGVQHFMQALTILMSPARWTNACIAVHVCFSCLFFFIIYENAGRPLQV